MWLMHDASSVCLPYIPELRSGCSAQQVSCASINRNRLLTELVRCRSSGTILNSNDLNELSLANLNGIYRMHITVCVYLKDVKFDFS